MKVECYFSKTAITGAFHRESRQSVIKKLSELKASIVRKFSKVRLKFNIVIVQCTEAAIRGGSVKKLFLKISQYSQENTYVGASY